MAKRQKPKQIELRVVFDTNVLYTGSASFLVRKEVADLISANQPLPDLRIGWYLPEVVRHERQYQMLQVALVQLKAVEKLERLLAHNLNITADILETRVREAVDRQVQQHGLVVRFLAHGDVDWARVILDATYRRPPFQGGEAEKGFRDAVILETFLQLVRDSPTSSSVCRVALVSTDQLLRDATLERTRATQNVHVLESIDALKGLINTLGSTLDEQFLSNAKVLAADLFYKPSNTASLYYKADIAGAVRQSLSAATIALPSGAAKYSVEQLSLADPRFDRKQGQRIHWITRFEARLRALRPASVANSFWTRKSNVIIGGGMGEHDSFHSLPSNVSFFGQPPSARQTSIVSFGSGSEVEGIGNYSSLAGFGEDQLLGYGTAFIDVSWSAVYTTSGTLTKARFDSASYIEVVWD